MVWSGRLQFRAAPDPALLPAGRDLIAAAGPESSPASLDRAVVGLGPVEFPRLPGHLQTHYHSKRAVLESGELHEAPLLGRSLKEIPLTLRTGGSHTRGWLFSSLSRLRVFA